MHEVEKSIEAIRALFSELVAGRQDYDFKPPALVSHARDHEKQPNRLRRYARQVIGARIMIFRSSTRTTTQALVQTYLLGVESKIPFPLLLAARSQLELYSVVADTIRIIKENAGEQEHTFVERVATVDHTLINATFGTRSTLLKESMKGAKLSRLRPTQEQDIEALNSKNILTRLGRLSETGAYPKCKADYERLCEFVHPNWGMNMLHMVPSPINPSFLRFSLTSGEPFIRALSVSASAMERAALGTVSAFDTLQAPFGMGEMTYAT